MHKEMFDSGEYLDSYDKEWKKCIILSNMGETYIVGIDFKYGDILSEGRFIFVEKNNVRIREDTKLHKHMKKFTDNQLIEIINKEKDTDTIYGMLLGFLEKKDIKGFRFNHEDTKEGEVVDMGDLEMKSCYGSKIKNYTVYVTDVFAKTNLISCVWNTPYIKIQTRKRHDLKKGFLYEVSLEYHNKQSKQIQAIRTIDI